MCTHAAVRWPHSQYAKIVNKLTMSKSKIHSADFLSVKYVYFVFGVTLV